MKIAIFATIVLLLSFGLVIANSILLRVYIDEILNEVREIEIDDVGTALMKFESAFKKFERREKFVSLTVSHSDLTSIEDAFCDIIGAGNAETKGEMIKTKTRLINSLEHLRRLSGINIDSILFIGTRSYQEERHVLF